MLLSAFLAIGPSELIIVLALFVGFAWPACRICSRAGFPWPLGLLAVVPLLNIGLLFLLAFADWPALRGQGKAEGDMIDSDL